MLDRRTAALLRVTALVILASCPSVVVAQTASNNVLVGKSSATGFASSVGPGACSLDLDLGKGASWGGHLLLEGRNTRGVKATDRGRRLLLASAVRPGQTLQIDARMDGQLKWLDAFTLPGDPATWPNDLPCSVDRSSEEPTWIASTDVGLKVDTFAGGPDFLSGGYQPPTEVLASPLAAPTLAVRPMGWTRWGGGALWFDMRLAYSVSPSLACNGNPAPAYCDGGTPGADDVEDIIKSATSAQVYLGPRLEFATLGPDSEFPTRAYVRGTLGSVWLLDTKDGKARDHRQLAGGLRVANGKLRDSFVEGGRALNELVTRDNEARLNRWYFSGGIYYAPGAPSFLPKWLGKAPPTRIFVRVALDRASGPDYLQTWLGLSLDFSALAAPFNAAAGGK